VNEDQRKLADTLLVACDKLADAEAITLVDADAVAIVCAMLRPMVADAQDPEQLALQNLVYRTEEWVLTWIMRGRYSQDDLPEWLLGDASADFVAWETARVEYEQVVG
jgi:hypothetical protein